MDRHLTYVAMTGIATACSSMRTSISPMRAGWLITALHALRASSPGARKRYFVTLENDKSEQRTVVDVDLKRAIRDHRQRSVTGFPAT